jgi:hypothetical protein
MKKILLLTLSMAGAMAAFSQSQIINSWRDPNTSIQNPGFHKVIVAALLNDQGVRRQVEDYMVSLYPGMAMQSYRLIGDSLATNEEAFSQEFKNEGYDGIAIIKQTNEQTTQQYVPGRMPSYYNTWGGYWGWRGWGGPHWVGHYNPGTPGRVANQWHWYVQVNVYSLVSNSLVYTANTITTNPGGRVPLFEDVCNAVRTQMSAVGFMQ